jgi:hypothetical protein
MSITEWIVPWPADGRRSRGSLITAGAALPLDCHLVTGLADTGRRPGRANR